MIVHELQGFRQIEITDEYPYPEYIVRLDFDPKNNTMAAGWVFPGMASVELVYDTPDSAELLSISPHIILPMEGEDGKFYSKSEIEHFLTMVKKSVR